jgi:hypothetical protein
MKTSFETPEEQKFLYDLLWRGISSTEPMLYDLTNLDGEEFYEYKKVLFSFRQKCFELLEEEDPNRETNEAILKRINEKK